MGIGLDDTLAILSPGQGSQSLGMADQLLANKPVIFYTLILFRFVRRMNKS